MQIGVIGVGSIGSVLARGFDRLGHDVVVNDVDHGAVSALPYADRTKEWIAENCELAVFALPTPTTADGGDASVVDAALRPFRGTQATVLLRSTMPPGSTARLADRHDLPLVYSPEFLRDDSGVEEFFSPDRIVIAGPERERWIVRDLLDDPAIDCETVFEFSEYLTAELGKYAHNAFFATKVSFANQMRMVCESTSADVEAVMDVVTADHRNTSSHLDPTLGPYGGKCLPKDLGALRHYAATERGTPTPLFDAVRGVNDLTDLDFAAGETDERSDPREQTNVLSHE